MSQSLELLVPGTALAISRTRVFNRFRCLPLVLIAVILGCPQNRERNWTVVPTECAETSDTRPGESLERCRFRVWNEELRAIQRRYEADILRREGVVGMGIGRSEDETHPIFIVFVVDEENAPDLPRLIEGVQVHIQQRAPVRVLHGIPDCSPPCHAAQMPAPVRMGVSHGDVGVGSGCSLGFKACDLGTGNLVFVSNSHCYDFATCSLVGVGSDVQHPGPSDEVDDNSILIGEVAGHAAPVCSAQADNFTDATKVDSPNTLTSPRIDDIGDVSNSAAELQVGDFVRMSGRSTGGRNGTVTAVGISRPVPGPNNGGFCCGPLTMRDQVEWRPTTGPLIGGDSGSVLVSLEGPAPSPTLDVSVAGLNWGTDGTFAYANRVSRVLAALNLTLNLDQCQ